jgi:putative hemolysin
MVEGESQMVAVAVNTPFIDVLRTVTDSGYSRIPVYEDTLDRIIGILYVKDLLQVWGTVERIELRALLRPPIYIVESQRAVVAFQQLQQQRSALALVLEEMVGNIIDEYDQADDTIVQREDGSYLVDGLVPFTDLQEQLSLPELDTETAAQDFETVAGFVLALLGRIPAPGDTVRWQGYTFEVVDMDERRIDKILVQLPQIDSGTQTEGALASGAVLPPTLSLRDDGSNDTAARQRGE